jgi:hypothetical protein
MISVYQMGCAISHSQLWVEVDFMQVAVQTKILMGKDALSFAVGQFGNE